MQATKFAVKNYRTSEIIWTFDTCFEANQYADSLRCRTFDSYDVVEIVEPSALAELASIVAAHNSVAALAPVR